MCGHINRFVCGGHAVFISYIDTYNGKVLNHRPSKSLQVANQRNGVIFCFNEDLHGPKSENFLSVNAANQEEEESNYTLTLNHARRSQAKEIFIYDVSK
jgi:hypothetical protein